MADEPSRSISESVRLWLQAVGIPLVLAVLGLWQFVLKEVWWPATAVNLTTDITIKQAGLERAPSHGKELKAIQVEITALNPSTSTIYLLPNYWAAWGHTTSQPPESEDDSVWVQGAERMLDDRISFHVGKHYRTDASTLVAVGVATTDIYLRPHEKISETRVFYVPEGVYDSLSVVVALPIASRQNPKKPGEAAVGVDFEVTPSGIQGSYYRILPSGDHEALPTDKYNNVSQQDIRYYGLQLASSETQLSLWQSPPPEPPAETLPTQPAE